MSRIGSLKQIFFGMPLCEANSAIRNFEKGDAQERTELVAKTVIEGYNTAVEKGLSEDLLDVRLMIKNELSGFFNEGIGMGLYTLSLFSISQKNIYWDFVKGVGKPHEYMSYIGAGIACGVFNKPFEKFLVKANPTCSLLVLNGIGFYYAYFKIEKGLYQHYIRNDVKKDDFFVECYDNGVGRALWFCENGNSQNIKKIIDTFPKKRQAAIWSGIGLAATYAGGVEENEIRELKKHSGQFWEFVAEGSFLATHCRDIAGNSHNYDITEKILIGKSAEECHIFGRKILLDLKQEILTDGEYTFRVFLRKIRQWIKKDII
ncbi:MAG: DUF1702 family protein [Bacteroidales bacterium]|jgi:hypothetical protein|nr:DUF1702 family protein [Bacteroidales bacterium]